MELTDQCHYDFHMIGGNIADDTFQNMVEGNYFTARTLSPSESIWGPVTADMDDRSGATDGARPAQEGMDVYAGEYIEFSEGGVEPLGGDTGPTAAEYVYATAVEYTGPTAAEYVYATAVEYTGPTSDEWQHEGGGAFACNTQGVLPHAVEGCGGACSNDMQDAVSLLLSFDCVRGEGDAKPAPKPLRKKAVFKNLADKQRVMENNRLNANKGRKIRTEQDRVLNDELLQLRIDVAALRAFKSEADVYFTQNGNEDSAYIHLNEQMRKSGL
ncbi:hypothetical protein T484DRAFT_1857893 [Baffinella frigidus]|nr:hypothetical protein T484DRAFT_1857893 [Cryptophyta sp. CCMP2293]